VNTASPVSLDDYEWVEWAEDARNGMFSRYRVDFLATGEPITEWFCTDCAAPVEDIEAGCDVCGLGRPDDEI